MNTGWREALEILREEFPSIPDTVRSEGDETLRHFLRRIGSQLAGVAENPQTAFVSAGLMLDVSRGGVMTVPHLKKWFRRMALAGLNTFLLYTENTYELPGEPYFGYCRGAYSAEEIRELDVFARRLGIELVGCIQTLGHLEQILRWNAYSEVKDTDWVLLTDSDKTYALIEKMIAFWSENLSSRRLHIGMDEAFSLGGGNRLKKFGYEPQSVIFNRHLGRVRDLCRKHGVSPMIWSDMYVHMGDGAKLPEGVTPVGWDYDHDTVAYYSDFIDRQRALGNEPVIASALWTCGRFWHDHDFSARCVPPCIEACRRRGVKDIFFTLWGDGGCFCEFDSAWTGIVLAANRIWGVETDEAWFHSMTSLNYRQFCEIGKIRIPLREKGLFVSPSAMLWEDPLFRIAGRELDVLSADWQEQTCAHLKRLLDITPPDGLTLYPHRVMKCVVGKLELMQSLRSAYHAADKTALARIAVDGIPRHINDLELLLEAYRRQWLRRNKPFGMELFQLRVGGNIARWKECMARIHDFLDGKETSIPELEISIVASGNSIYHFDWVATGYNLV